MAEKHSNRERIAALEGKLQSLQDTTKRVLVTSWNEIKELKEQNGSMKKDITQLESQLNDRNLMPDEFYEPIHTKSGPPALCSNGQQQSPSIFHNIAQVRRRQTMACGPSQREGRRIGCRPFNRLHRCMSSLDLAHSGCSFRSCPPSIPSPPVPVPGIENFATNPEHEDTAVKEMKQQPSVRSLILKSRKKIPTTSNEKDLRRLISSITMTFVDNLHELQTKLRGKEAALATMVRTRTIQDVTIASLRHDLAEFEKNYSSSEECEEKLGSLKQRSAELDEDIARISNNLEHLERIETLLHEQMELRHRMESTRINETSTGCTKSFDRKINHQKSAVPRLSI